MPSYRARTLTHAAELHSRAAQLEGFSDQANLRRVHVRGTHVKVIQQVLNAPRDAPTGDPAHVPCGGQGVRKVRVLAAFWLILRVGEWPPFPPGVLEL